MAQGPAAAQPTMAHALGLMAAANKMGAARAAAQDTASGPGGMSMRELAMVLHSDSSSESEGEEQAVTAQGQPPPPPQYQEAKVVVSAGPVGKHTQQSLALAAPVDLEKEVWQVDSPQSYLPAYRRLKKKTTVKPTLRLGRALKQLASQGHTTGGVLGAKQLWTEIHCGTAASHHVIGLRGTRLNNVCYSACRTSLKRLCSRNGSCKVAEKELQPEASRLTRHMFSTTDGMASALLLSAAQRSMYEVRGPRCNRQPLPGGAQFNDTIGANEFAILPASGFLVTCWLSLHTEPEVVALLHQHHDDASLVASLAQCERIRSWFSCFYEDMKSVAHKRKYEAFAVTLELGTHASERGRLHVHVYVGANPGCCTDLGEESFPKYECHRNDFEVDTASFNVRRVWTRNGKGIRKGLEGALYYVMANKIGTVLTCSTVRLWQDRGCDYF